MHARPCQEICGRQREEAKGNDQDQGGIHSIEAQVSPSTVHVCGMPWKIHDFVCNLRVVAAAESSAQLKFSKVRLKGRCVLPVQYEQPPPLMEQAPG